PQAVQSGPGTMHGAAPGNGQYHEAQIGRPEGSGVEGHQQVSKRQGEQRPERHRAQAITLVQPAGHLEGDNATAELKGSRRLDLATRPAKGLLQWQDQGSEGIYGSDSDRRGNADQRQNQNPPALTEL